MGASRDLAAVVAALAAHALLAGGARLLPPPRAPVVVAARELEIELIDDRAEPDEAPPPPEPPKPDPPAPPPPAPRWLPPRPAPPAPQEVPPLPAAPDEPPSPEEATEPDPAEAETEEKEKEDEDEKDDADEEEEEEAEEEEEPEPPPPEPAPLVPLAPVATPLRPPDPPVVPAASEIAPLPALPEAPEDAPLETPLDPPPAEPPPAADPPAAEPPVPVAPAAPPAPAPGPAAVEPAVPVGPTGDPGVPPPEGPLPPPGSAGEYGDTTAPPTGPGLPGLPGLPGEPVWTLPGVVTTPRSGAAPTAAPRAVVDPRAATKALGGTLQTRDKEKGINVPAAGEVASAVATAVRSTPAPHNARATFEIRLGPKGEILGASVVKSSAGNPAEWQAALERAKAQLAAQGLAMTGAAKNGAVVRVSITTKHLYPTGTGKKLEMRPQCANALVNEAALAARKKADLEVTDPNALPPDVPGANPFVDENGLPCIPVGMSGGMDLSNIGAHRQLVVQTQFDVKLPDEVALPADIHEVNTDVPWADVGKPGPRPTLPYAIRKRIEKRKKKR